MTILRTLFLFSWLLLPAAAAERPNVVVIFTDDQGSLDLGCYGSEDLITPHTDALAARGIRFTQFYSAAPVCSPSRAGLLTGRYPARAGVPGNCSSQKGGDTGLPPEEETLAELFKGAGYRTAHVGKWHLGYVEEKMPNAQGFDHSFGHMGGCIDNFSHFFYWSGPNVHDLHRNGEEIHLPGQYFPDLMVDEALEFIGRDSQEPFFLFFAMNTPHYPYQGDPEFLEQLAHLEYPRNLYAAFLASQDRCIGRLLDGLGEEAENTIVVFQSDNGHSEEERAHFGGGNPGPYRGEKFSLFEGGIRLPAILSWPAKLPQGEVRDQLAHSCDWFPTLAELCGIDVDGDRLNGRSLVPVLESPEAPSPHQGQAMHWHVGNGARVQWAVRLGDWKLIGNVRGGDAEEADRQIWLSNLASDVGESQNLRETHPEKVQELQVLRDAFVEGLSR